MQIVAKATEMRDASVSFISLVERGANRIPFKIVKQETDMSKGLDLAGLGKFFTQKTEVPAQADVVAVVTMKDDGFDSVVSQIEESGFHVAEFAELDDGSVVFKQDELEASDDTVVRISDHSAVITRGFTAPEMSESVFGEEYMAVCKAENFVPGLGTTMDFLRIAALTVIEKSEDSETAAKDVASLFDAAKNYAVGLVTTLPASVFKLETVFPEEPEELGIGDAEEVCKACGTKKSKKKMPTDMAMKDDATAEVEDDAGVSEEVTAEALDASSADDAAASVTEEEVQLVQKSAEPAPKVLTEEEVAGIVSAKVDETMTVMTKKMDAMLEEMSSGITKTLKQVSDGLTTLNNRVGEVESVAKSANEAVAGITIAGGDSDDETPLVKKHDRDGFGTHGIDTAYMPRGMRRVAGR